MDASTYADAAARVIASARKGELFWLCPAGVHTVIEAHRNRAMGRAILRLIEPSSGSIRFQGSEITHLPAKQLRALSNLHDFSRLADGDTLTAQFVRDPIRQIGEVERPSFRLNRFAKL